MRLRRAGFRRGIAHRERDLLNGMGDGIEHRDVIGAQLQGPVNQAVGIDGGIVGVLVGGARSIPSLISRDQENINQRQKQLNIEKTAG